MRKRFALLPVVALAAAVGCESATEPEGLRPDAASSLETAAVSEILAPAAGEIIYSDELQLLAYSDNGSAQWAVRYDTCDRGTNTLAGNVDGYDTPAAWDAGSFSATIDVAGWTDGSYCFVFNTGAERLTREFELDSPQPYVRITYMCQVPSNPDGNHALLWNGVETELHPASAGQYVWRIGYPGDDGSWLGVDQAEFVASFPGLGSLGVEGTIGEGEVQFHMTDQAANGVSVSTTPGPNLYGGTASVNPNAVCQMAYPTPGAKDDCKDGGWQYFGFRNQGQCIASITASEQSGH